MSRDPYLRLEDILEAGETIEEYLKGYDFSEFQKDRRTVDAVTRNLEILGETTKHIPQDWKEKAPHIQWRAIAGFRDILAHSYFRTEDAILWDTASNHIPALLEVVRELLGSRDSP